MPSYLTVKADGDARLDGAMINVHPNGLTLYLLDDRLEHFHTPQTWDDRDKKAATRVIILRAAGDHIDQQPIAQIQDNTVHLPPNVVNAVHEADPNLHGASSGQVEDIKYFTMDLRAFKFPITRDYHDFNPLLAEMAASLGINYQSLMKQIQVQ